MLAAFGAIRRGAWGSMLAYVGYCWGHVGFRWSQVGSTMALDRFMLPQVGPKMPKRPPNASQVPKDEAKMAPIWLPNQHVWASMCFFRNLLPDLRFPTFLLFWSWESIFLTNFEVWELFKVTSFDDF